MENYKERTGLSQPTAYLYNPWGCTLPYIGSQSGCAGIFTRIGHHLLEDFTREMYVAAGGERRQGWFGQTRGFGLPLPPFFHLIDTWTSNIIPFLYLSISILLPSTPVPWSHRPYTRNQPAMTSSASIDPSPVPLLLRCPHRLQPPTLCSSPTCSPSICGLHRRL